MRSAEQRWPAEPKAERITSSITCSRWAVVSTNMALRPPVSAMKGRIASRARAARLRLMARAVSVPPVKATPARSGCTTSAAPTVSPGPGSRCSTSSGRPACLNNLHRGGGDAGRLLRRLGDHSVAGRQRRGDLAGEDGEGKIPWADAGEDAAAMQLQRDWSRRRGL